MNDHEYQEKYQILKDQLIDGRKLTLAELSKTNADIIKANREYREDERDLSGNTFIANGRKPGGKVENEMYQRQLNHLKDIRDEKHNKVIRPGAQQRVKEYIKEEFDEAPDRVEQLENEIADDPDLKWLQYPNQEEREQEIDVWEELDQYPEEDEVDEGFPGDEEGDGTQNQQLTQNPINLQTEFPGFDVGEPGNNNNVQPDHNPSNGNSGRRGPDMEPG